MATRVAARLPLHLQRSHAPTLAAVRRARPAWSSFESPRTTFTAASLRREPMAARDRLDPPLAQFHTQDGSGDSALPTLRQPASQFHTQDSSDSSSPSQPGSIAFGECEIQALSDLFLSFAKTKDSVNDGAAPTPYLNKGRIKLLLESVGEKPDDATLQSLLDDSDAHGDGKLRLDCFLRAADRILGEAPARIVLVVGGPGSGKGALCERLAAECGAIHLSCGEMLREEVESGTPLGKEVAAIMERGDLVSSAAVTALMRRRMRRHPGRRILLDGFPRSLENARDFVELCGPPELALHLDCDDTVLIERILARGARSYKEAERAAAEGREVSNIRSDDNVHTAIQRLKNYHKHHQPTMNWLKEIRVPIVNMDCSGTKEDVWGQLVAIGRLMRPVVKLPQPQAIPRPQQVPQPLNGAPANGEKETNEDLRWIA